MIQKHAHEELLNKVFIVPVSKKKECYTKFTTKDELDSLIKDLDVYTLDLNLEALL